MKEKLDEKTEETTKEEYEEETMAIAVSLKYQGNSELLAGFYDAIESKLIK
jgi:hypothetical protein